MSSSSKNVLLVTDSYPPEIRSASLLMQELAEGLLHRGYNVTVATTFPQYNMAENVKVSNDDVIVEKGIKIIRVKTLPHHKVNFLVRGIAQLTMPYKFLSCIKKYSDVRYDYVLVYSPPLTLYKVGAKIKKMFGARFVLNVQDIFPQNAIDLGILNNKFLIKVFEHIEKKAYKSADVITAHSEGNREFLLRNKKNVGNKIKVLHNWIDLTTYQNITRTNKFRKKYGIEDKVVVLFAGVLGPSQGLDIMIRAAQDEQLEGFKDLLFLFVGDGMEKQKLQTMCKERNINNVMFQPFVAQEEYPALVKDSDIGLVCLTSKNKTPVVPGKILGYMAAGIPVLAFLNKESDGHGIIKDAQCGYSAVSSDYSSVVNCIKKIYENRQSSYKYGQNGLGYVKKHFAKDVCLDSIEELLLK